MTKLYYTIGEVARLFEVNASLIRFWEKEFDVLKPVKNKKGNRLFTQADIDNLKLIYHLVKEKGFTLQGARDEIRIHHHGPIGNSTSSPQPDEIRQSLLKIKKELSEILESL